MTNIILKTALKNAVVRTNRANNYEFHLNNISINGNKRGCSGFIKNAINNKIVYVNTETSPLLQNKLLIRYAKSLTDYTGEQNHFANSKDKLTEMIITMLA